MTTITRAELEALLGADLGKLTASAVLRVAIRDVGLLGDEWSTEDALLVLGTLATTPGRVGAAARFTKVRLLLKAAV